MNLSGLQAWLAHELTEGKAIWADGDGKIPERTFATLKVLSAAREGQPYRWPMGADGIQHSMQDILITLTVNVYSNIRGQALTIADRLAASPQNFNSRLILRQTGWAYVQTLSGPSDISAIVGSDYESRAVFDLQLRTNALFSEYIGWIERVVITGTLEASDDKEFTTTTEVGEA